MTTEPAIWEMEDEAEERLRLEDRAARISAAMRVLCPALWLAVGCLVGSLVTALALAAVLP